MKVSLSQIKSWFKKGMYPTESQFANTFDSFWHTILNQYGFKMLIGVHDELIGQCKEEYKDICANRLCEVMKTCVSDIVDVPFKCDPSVVRRWYEDEMGYSLQEKLNNLISEGKTREEAKEILHKKNSEFTDEEFETLLTIE